MSGSMLDDDARRAVGTGRATLGAMLRAAQKQLQKVFVVFVLGLVGTVYFMRVYGWDALRRITEARMDAATAASADVIVRTPFDVILLQVKLGLLAGVLLAVPMILYYAREPLRERGRWPDVAVTRVQVALVAALAVGLFLGGVAYAYFVFFPVAFDFLTTYTLNVGFEPKYDLVKWTHFILILTISFGLAAQLPLAMSALAYTEVVPYEFFREKWRHAAVLIFAFGALFSPPDPFTQIMWAVPLLVLYGASLYLAKFVTAVRRGGSAMVRAKLSRNWRRIAGPFAVVGVGTYVFLEAGGSAALNEWVLPLVPAGLRPAPLPAQPVGGEAGSLVAAALVGGVVALPLLVYYSWPELQPRGQTGDPRTLDVGPLDAAGVRAAPVETFEAMSEDEAVSHARQAMDAGDAEKARAVLDRFDDATADEAEEDATAEAGRSAGDVAAETTTGVVNAFTREEKTEEELGGYAYDLAFILESLTSKSFRVVALFMAATLGTFFALYGGVFRYIRADFFSRLPDAVPVEEVSIVALHPVEALLFEVKMSLIAGAVAILPAVAYYAWPAVEERFYGIVHDYSTPPPGVLVRRNWNKVAAFFVLAAAGAYVALTGYPGAVPVALPDAAVTLAGVSLSPETLAYLAAGAAGLVATAPVAFYYAWPSLRERWAIESKRGAFVLWAGTLLLGLLAGVAAGYAYIAPGLISYLVYDAIQAGMVISYTINDFFWLIFVTTVGIGLLADVPMTMWLFARTGIVSYRTMRERWRGIVFVVFVAAAVFTDRSVISMFLFGIPVTIMYWVGLSGLWAWTLPRRVLGKVKAGA